MADFTVEKFTISQEYLDLITTDASQVVMHTVYDRAPPAGWMITATGPLGSVIVCPKPCASVHLPTP